MRAKLPINRMRARGTSLGSVLLLLAHVLFPESEWGSTLTVELSRGQLAPQDLTINQGDTVRVANANVAVSKPPAK